MKFYLAIDSDGRKQLRGTQDDIKKISKIFEQVDIPTDKEGLQHLVQDSFDRIFELERQLQATGITPVANAPGDASPPLPREDAEVLDVRILEEQVSALGIAGVDGLDHFDGWSQTIGISAAFQQGVALLNIIAADDSQLAKIFLRNQLQKRIKRRTY